LIFINRESTLYTVSLIKLRCDIPALLIKTSIWPNRSRIQSTFDWKPYWWSSRSNGKIIQRSESRLSSVARDSSSRSRLADKTRRVVGERRTNSLANSRPIPDDAPKP